MSMEEMGEVEINNPGFYTSVCLLLDIAALPVTAVLQVLIIFPWQMNFDPETKLFTS